MAFSASGLFVPTFRDILDASVLNIDLDVETHKVAMFTNSITTPDFLTNTRYGAAPFNANEVTGTAYSAGGTAVTGTTFTDASSNGILVFQATDTSWASSTIANARGALIYADADATTPDAALVGVAFGADYSTNNGTFLIDWASGGIFTWDVVP